MYTLSVISSLSVHAEDSSSENVWLMREKLVEGIPYWPNKYFFKLSFLLGTDFSRYLSFG
jgi:hypothetical protein